MTEINLPKIEEAKTLLSRMEESMDLKKAESTLAKFMGSFTLYLVDEKDIHNNQKLEEKLCKSAKEKERIKESCLKNIRASLDIAKKTKRVASFRCPLRTYGFSYPLQIENEIFGFLIGCNIAQKPPQAMIDLFGYFTETVLSGIKKELQLENLYKTVKPRAIALSTVHTVHRLITSSLYLDELLDRIARLSMQIIKANRCSIKLVDSRRKVLLPKATVDLRKKEAKLKKVKIGRWAPGKAVKYGKSIMDKDYLATPLIDEDVIGVITLYDKVDGQPFNNFDSEIMKTLAEQSAVAIKNAQLYREQEKLTMGSIKALAQIIESKGAGIQAPKSSFLRLVQLIGLEFEMREHELKTLQYARLLHDAGELMVPERVLRKKGKLTDKEYKMIKEHPLKGAKIIKSLKSLKSIAPIIMYHHENFDGSGYPKGLKGKSIPLGARILAVVSAFEAMTAKRPYRVPLTMGRATEEIRKNAGKQFDPKVVAAFLKTIKRKDVVSLLKKDLYGVKKKSK